MPPELTFDYTTLDFNRILYDKSAIQALLPQRFEMEQLDAIVHADAANHIIVGYKDVHADEFWARGHIPGNPLFPGVLMCEAAAQLCSFHVILNKLTGADFVGFGGMDEVRFRSAVRPGDRFVIVGKGLKIHRRQCTFAVQGFVGSTMVYHGNIIGVAMPRTAPPETPK